MNGKGMNETQPNRLNVAAPSFKCPECRAEQPGILLPRGFRSSVTTCLNCGEAVSPPTAAPVKDRRPLRGWEELVIALVIAGMVAGAFALVHLIFG